ncbi:MAG: hypothetical protein IJB86_06045 [Clostridia bacterium]|nr:hypothetical protein [Clostridia bacterium]
MNTIINVYKSLNEKTKAALIFGCVYIMITASLGAACYLGAGTFIGYYAGMEYAAAFLTCTRSCIGITGIGALLIEAVSKDG